MLITPVTLALFYHPTLVPRNSKVDGSRIRRLAPSYAPSHFCPNERRIYLALNATPYQQAHETAHSWQQLTETRAWLAHRRFLHSPWVCRWTRLWLEIEAARMALRTMRWLGTWTYAAQVEARKSLLTYFGALFF